MRFIWLGLSIAPLLAMGADLRAARDRQDKPALQSAVSELAAAAGQRANDSAAQYQLALAESYLAEVLQELGDKKGAAGAAQDGIRAAERAVELKGTVAEHHRILGTLCGQVIPANVLLAMRFGRCAMDSVKKAIELDPQFSDAYLSRGVGNYYLPPTFGGGPELAVQDFRKAIQLSSKSSEAYLWLGIALRKLGKNQEARSALQQSVALNPNRVWARQQLEKTPAK